MPRLLNHSLVHQPCQTQVLNVIAVNNRACNCLKISPQLPSSRLLFHNPILSEIARDSGPIAKLLGMVHISGMPTTRPSGSSWALPEWNEHRGVLPILPVGIPEECDQVVFFKLNGQENVARRRDGK